MRKFVLGLFLVTAFSSPTWADNKAPSTVSGVSATAISDSKVRVTWNKPWDDVGVRGYNVYRNGGYHATVFDTNYIDTGVSSNNEYRYGIVAFDKAKNYNGVSKEASVKVGGSGSDDPLPPPPDDGGVNPPQGLSAEILNDNQAKVKWSAPSGNIRGYNVYINNNYQSTVSSPEYVANSLNYGEDYKFSIVAFNQSKRFSRHSAALTVNTSDGSSRDPDDKTDEPKDDGGNGSVPSGYKMVFSDEFNKYNLDNNKWNSKYRWGPGWIINGEKQYYVDRINNPDFGHSPFEFDGNHMTITAVKTPEHLRSSANWQPYLSGALTTYNKFKTKYGYVEMRAKLPKGKGLWSAFWLLHQHDNNRRPEIDVMEYIGDQPNKVFNTYHNWNQRLTPTYEVPGPDYSQDFHTYAVKWEPGKITWYVDGKERNSHSNGNVAAEEMYLLVNLAVGGSWPGDPDGNTQFPARFKIDYIRAYQKN